MASFYICHPHPTPIIGQNQLINVVDALSACKVLRKAAIKLHQVSGKLQISKVIRFLENLPLHCQKTTGNQPNSQERLLSEVSQQHITTNFIENEMERSPSILQISTTRSLMSSDRLNQLDQNNSIYKKLGKCGLQKQKTNTPSLSNKENRSGLVQTFKWREVVTKNALDQGQGNRRVRFKDNSITQIHDNQNNKEFQLLKEENQRLKTSVMNIFKFFNSKQLLQLPSYINQLQLNDIESISKDLFGTFEKRQVQLEFQRKKLMQVHSEYLLTLKNISIEQRLQASQLKPNQASIAHKVMGSSDLRVQNIDLPTRVKQLITSKTSKVEQMKRSVYQLQERLKKKQEQIKKYEMMLFIKQEQISSLRVLNSDLQNKLNKLNKTEDRPRSARSKSYKKFFKHLDQDQNMSSTFT